MNQITLKDILNVFNAPVSEEQCWAILNEATSYLLEQLSSSKPVLTKFSELDCVHFDSGGNICIVFESQLTEKQEQLAKVPLEQEVLRCLGVVVFHALDYSLSEAEEHVLSESMESLLDRMVSGEEDDREKQQDGEHDEGIVQDGGCRNPLTLAGVVELCHLRLSEPLSAPAHYKAVCRAMVTEAIELKAFLGKVCQEKAKIETMDSTDPELIQMHQADWARLWMQVVRQLRNGVTLRKITQLNLPRIEYELTPYEMLLDDIRSRRYLLNKVPSVDSGPMKAEPTAHDVILNFIRSRPTLLPVQHRQLRDLSPPERGVRERMLDAIKQESRLRSAPNLASLTNQRMSLDETALTISQPRKVIKPDLSLIQAYSFDTEAGLSDEDDDMEKNKVVPPPITPFTPLSPTKTALSHWPNTAQSYQYDQPMSKQRRQTVPVCDDLSRHLVSLPSADCLSLTIEEVMHIRRVLAKAELESLIVHPELYQLVSKGKVCFTCLKTKFAILGPWGVKCHICARIVCNRCMQKMRVPTEHFERIPVHTLSPGALSPANHDASSLQGWSASKPAVCPHGDSEHCVSSKVVGELERARTVVYETSQKLFEGPVMNICLDCGAMLLEIIRASRLSVAPHHDAAHHHYQPTNVAVNFL